MSFWQETAAKIQDQPNEEWSHMLLNNLENSHPRILAEVTASGDLEAYLKVRVTSAQDEMRALLESGMDHQSALEMAMEQLLQPAIDDADHPEDWEIDGATADMAAAVQRLFGL